METKYLSDGKKVAVVGKLNNQETIVQEIFVNESGDEIPSGERFVVKSLHDTPVESWKERNAKETEKRIAKLERKEEELNREIRGLAEKRKAYADIVRSNQLLTKNIAEEEVEVFSMFLTGNVNYLVVDSYRLAEPVEIMDEIISWDRYRGEKRYNGIKLLSVMGRSEGKLSYNINRYYDGSGGDTRCYPFASYEDAVDHIKERAIKRIEKGHITTDDLEVTEKLGIEFSNEHKDQIVQILSKDLESSKANREKEIKKAGDSIAELDGKLKSILGKYS